jgi:hypothetical protein
VSEEAKETKQQAFENSIMEVRRKYNLRSKNTDEISPKKVTKMKKIVETKKSAEPSTKKIPKKGNVEAPAKRNPTILQRSTQTKVSSTNQPSTSTQKTMVDKLELLSQSRASTPFSLEGELAKVKIPIPLSELMSKDSY